MRFNDRRPEKACSNNTIRQCIKVSMSEQSANAFHSAAAVFSPNVSEMLFVSHSVAYRKNKMSTCTYFTRDVGHASRIRTSAFTSLARSRLQPGEIPDKRENGGI